MPAARRSLLAPPPSWTRHSGPGFSVIQVPSALEDSRTAFTLAFARGLAARPRILDCRYLYDAAGSEIFERITEQPEYYQTRTEDRLLARLAPSLRAQVGDVTLVELGSGSSTKTRRLL